MVKAVTDFLLLSSKIKRCGWWLQPWNQKTFASWQESYGKPRQCVEKQRHYYANKGPNSQDYGLSRGHIWLWDLNSKEGRVPKNCCLPTVVLEKTPQSPLDSKEIKPILGEINPEYSLEGLMLKLKLQYFGHLTGKADSLEKSLMLGKIEGRKKRGHPEDEMAGWMASPMQWTWAWANFRRCWGTGRPGVVKYWLSN